MSEPWKCGCLVKDPVELTLHWVIQPSWVTCCGRCGSVAPMLMQPMKRRRGHDWPSA